MISSRSSSESSSRPDIGTLVLAKCVLLVDTGFRNN